MIVVLAGVNRDPAVFDQPLAFKPERMMGEAFNSLPLGVKRWFGNGERECMETYELGSSVWWCWQRC